MASADLRDELTCSICLSIYTDPVNLMCGHSFCRLCVEGALDAKERSGPYECPECRAEFVRRPALEKNRKLRNIVETFQAARLNQEEVGIPCTYCIQFPVPAATTCLLCEASLCEKHLRVHSKSAEHVLTEPTTSLGNKKCSIHKKVLEYYCSDDAACICVYCLAGEHRGHLVETLIETSEKKEKLRNILEKLTLKKEEAEKRVQSLHELKSQVHDKATRERERVTSLIKDIREQLEVLEKRVLSEISRQEEQVSLQFSDLIQKLEINKHKLSRKMSHIEDLCKMTDPVTVLQVWDSDRADFFDSEWQGDEANVNIFKKLCMEDLNKRPILMISLAGLDVVASGAKRWQHVSEASDTLQDVNETLDISIFVNTDSIMFLDVNTASNGVDVSPDLKTVSCTEKPQGRPETPDRFHYPQVLSSMSFSSGQHYWEVEGSESGGWMVGVAYPSIDRKGAQSWFGNNSKSWCLCHWNNQYSVRHDYNETWLPQIPSGERLRIYLDYEAGHLSFYELCYPVRHLHTFTATFTEPLHAAFWVFTNTFVRISS